MFTFNWAWLYGDGSIGSPFTATHTVNGVTLQQQVGSGQLAVTSGGSTVPLSWGGSALLHNDPRLADWTALAAANVNGSNALLWRRGSTGELTTWSFDTAWNPAGGTGISGGSSPAGFALESAFSFDANGDGSIGEPISPVEQLRGRILAASPNANALDPFSAVVSGGPAADRLLAPAGSNILISGHDLITGLALPAAAVDMLDCGNLSDRCTVLIASTTDQPFADDGDSGYTLVRNLDTTRDDLILPASGFTTAARSLSFEGSIVNGLGIHLDSNHNGLYDSSDNLIALLAGVTTSPRIAQI